jgi:hypothetical protein
MLEVAGLVVAQETRAVSCVWLFEKTKPASAGAQEIPLCFMEFEKEAAHSRSRRSAWMSRGLSRVL